MSLKNYIHNLQQRPVRERERIAVIATAVGFAVIFLIWIVSFNEMNKSVEQPVDQTSASLNDLKNNFRDGRDSIQDMMQELPASPTGGPSETDPAGTDTSSGTQSLGTDSSVDNWANSPAPAENNNSDQNDKNLPSVPQLP